MATAGARLCAIDHIMSDIARYCDRPTLVQLMCVNKRTFKLAARPLYHTVSIFEFTIESFMDGTPGKTCSCDLCLEMFKQDFGFTDNTGQFAPTGNRDCKRGLTEADVLAGRMANATLNDESSSSTSAASDVSNGDDDEDEPEIVLPIPKKELLSYVRVLSLGSHHYSYCSVYGERLAKYLTNLDVLRIVEVPSWFPTRTNPLCTLPPFETCRIIAQLKPRKLVLRNVSSCFLPVEQAWSIPEETKEVVVVLPTVHLRYAGPDGKGPQNLSTSYMGQFSTAESLKIVFWPEWDDSFLQNPLAKAYEIERQGSHIVGEFNRQAPLFVDHIAEVLRSFCYARNALLGGSAPLVSVYGFGNVPLTNEHQGKNISDLVTQHYKTHPNGPAPDLHRLAKAVVSAKMISVAMSMGRKQSIHLGSCPVKWYTMSSYENNLSNRKAEIDEFD